MKQDFYWICWWLFSIYVALIFISFKVERIADALEKIAQVAK